MREVKSPKHSCSGSVFDMCTCAYVVKSIFRVDDHVDCFGSLSKWKTSIRIVVKNVETYYSSSIENAY